MSLFGIYRSSSLLWLRRRTSCSASVPVTGGSVSVELLHRQLDLVTGIAAFLLSICASVNPSPVPSESLQDWQDLESLGVAIVPKPTVRATASRRGRSPAPLGQRADGLRCSRLHSGVCSHTPRLPPARSCLPHKSQFTWISYLASASPSPHICWAVRSSQASREKLVSDMGRRGFDRMRSPRAAAMIALASATGQAPCDVACRGCRRAVSLRVTVWST
jgi:hypothetical protein